MQDVNWLAQAPFIPDVIESAASKYGKAHVIKSHHNVGGLPERMTLKLVEPLRNCLKTKSVKLACISVAVADLPTPVSGARSGRADLGEIKPSYADVLREADAIFIQELRAADLYDQVSQAFAVYLPVKSVGVVGDARRYEHVIALRAVETIDFRN